MNSSNKNHLSCNNELFSSKNHLNSNDELFLNRNQINSNNYINNLNPKLYLKKESSNGFLFDQGREGSDEDFFRVFRQNRLERAQLVIAEKKRDTMINLKVRRRFQNLLEKIEKKEEIKDPMQSESFRSIIRNGNSNSTDRRTTNFQKKYFPLFLPFHPSPVLLLLFLVTSLHLIFFCIKGRKRS